MSAPKNSPEILSLSNDAQAVLAGYWGFGATFTLTMRNQESRFTPRAQSAFSELIKDGIILDEKADDGYAESRTYSLSEKGKKLEFRKSLAWVDEHAKFSTTEPIT
eukprot:GHVR01075256.1.p2 GENE.GHVR01075256.1~~GHVR01075256.1.p2  ORF type:complete len:106 (-),score=4.03 GHVR01075256.1:526-843(-)